MSDSNNSSFYINNSNNTEQESVPLPKTFSDKLLVVVLGWLIPGLGHIYQHRTAKGLFFALCIIPILIAGILMSSYRHPQTNQLEICRIVYYGTRPGDKNLSFVAHAMIGAVALPAFFQAKYTNSGIKEGFLCNIFAPPAPAGEASVQPSQNDILRALYSWYDIASIYLLSAGFLNLLAIFDALGGPVFYRDEKETQPTKNSNEDLSV